MYLFNSAKKCFKKSEADIIMNLRLAWYSSVIIQVWCWCIANYRTCVPTFHTLHSSIPPTHPMLRSFSIIKYLFTLLCPSPIWFTYSRLAIHVRFFFAMTLLTIIWLIVDNVFSSEVIIIIRDLSGSIHLGTSSMNVW